MGIAYRNFRKPREAQSLKNAKLGDNKRRKVKKKVETHEEFSTGPCPFGSKKISQGGGKKSKQKNTFPTPGM